MAPAPDRLPTLPAGGSGSSRYSTNQTAILTPLTSVSRPHHQDTGFDQAREPDRACHSKLIRCSAVIELTYECNNTFTYVEPNRDESMSARGAGRRSGRRAAIVTAGP